MRFTVFRDSQRVLHICYLKKGKTVGIFYCANLKDRLDVELQKKCYSTITMQRVVHTPILVHPPNSPDLALFEFFLVINLKVTPWS